MHLSYSQKDSRSEREETSAKPKSLWSSSQSQVLFLLFCFSGAQYWGGIVNLPERKKKRRGENEGMKSPKTKLLPGRESSKGSEVKQNKNKSIPGKEKQTNQVTHQIHIERVRK